MKEPSTLLVTGGAGFIGSNFVHRAIDDGHRVVTLDALTYAGSIENLTTLSATDRHTFVHGSINDRSLVSQLLAKHRPQTVINFAAQTHVDRSIDDPCAFVNTNVVGTHELLEATLSYWRGLSGDARERFRFLHISTDEVYGPLAQGRSSENSRYAPSSPYAASKAAADHLVRAYHVTFGLPVLITNCGNNYGPRQFPEKLIPLMILTALAREKLPVYGDGKHVRDWLHVDDHCSALMQVIDRGRPGETYNIGAHCERCNIDVVRRICDILDRLRPREGSYQSLISYVADRPGHDRRYSLDTSRIAHELGWQPMVSFEEGLERTMTWYLNNPLWCERVQGGKDNIARVAFGRAG